MTAPQCDYFWNGMVGIVVGAFIASMLIAIFALTPAADWLVRVCKGVPAAPVPKLCEKCGHHEFYEPEYNTTTDKLVFKCGRCKHKQDFEPLTKREK